MKQKILNGLRVLISGGTSGLGRASVAAFLREGARVATFARNDGELSALRAEFPELACFQADISRKEDIHRIAALSYQALGGVDVLIHNASTLGPTPLRPLLDTDCEDFLSALLTNVVGPFRLSKALLPGMIAQGSGLLVHLSSDAAVQAYPNWGAYSVSKAAGDHLSRLWQAELAEQGIRCVAVDPGDMRTAMHFAAVPDADAAQLKDPTIAARQLVALVRDNTMATGRVKL